uniref:Zinc finger CCCH domain-containing protein 67 n=1 Tax=Aegilops tauschii TaxID=37682 RepID=N1QSC3_AEGTA
MGEASEYDGVDVAAVSARLLELVADDDVTALVDLLAAHPLLADEPAPWVLSGAGRGAHDAAHGRRRVRLKGNTVRTKCPGLRARKEWPPDPSLPDIKNGAYASDDFRMYSFKVRACSRAYSHDWTECPFVHPGENARRRDPRKYHYSCVPCPEFKKGAGCRRGDMCEYAHGVFESWLHPAQYRTRLCKAGIGCARRVCFFAHTPEELRPLYVSTGSAGAAPPAMTETTWDCHRRAGNLHLSRLRTSLSARAMAVDELLASGDYDNHLGSPASVRSARGKALVPSNLDELFSAEMAASHSPRYGDQGGAAFSPTHKAAFLNQFQQHQRGTMTTTLDRLPLCDGGLPLAAREKMQQQTLRSMSSRDLGSSAPLLVGSPVVGSSWSKWGLPSGTPDWGADNDELGRLKRSSSFDLRSGANTDEPDLSWVNTLVKEPTPEKSSTNGTMATESIGILGRSASHHESIAGDDSAILGRSANHREGIDGEEDAATGVIGGWLEQLQLDEMGIKPFRAGKKNPRSAGALTKIVLGVWTDPFSFSWRH